MTALIPLKASPLADAERDILTELLADKRSPNTRRAYRKDLRDFFAIAFGCDPSPEAIAQFLALERYGAISVVLRYKAHIVEKGLAEATVNRRLAAIKSLVAYARKVGKCQFSLEDIKGEKIVPYRDTSGISVEAFKRAIAIPNRNTLKGQRDYAILRLLWDNALRRGEISKTNVADFNAESGKLSILGKGRGTQAEEIGLTTKTVAAIEDWLRSRETYRQDAPLFIALDRVHRGQRLSGAAIYEIVRGVCQQAGIPKIVSPHRIRHSSITAALDATGGDVRMVQKLSRHTQLSTLTIYDDRRTDAALSVSQQLAEMI